MREKASANSRKNRGWEPRYTLGGYATSFTLTMTRVLISGYYGFGNTGDEAILVALLSDLRALRPDAIVTVVSGNPADTELEYGVEAVHWQHVGAIARAAEQADAMILGGGGLFQDHWPTRPENMLTPRHANVDNWAGFALLSRLTGTPLMIYGVGVGPLTTTTGRDCTRLAFRQAGAVTVRDRHSRDVLVDIGVDAARIIVAADPAYSITPSDLPDELEAELSHHNGPTVAVALRPWGDHPTRSDWVAEVASGLDEVVEGLEARLLFVPFQHSAEPIENDGALAAAVCRGMRQVDRTTILRGDYTPSEIAATLARCDLVIGMRLHSVELAAVATVPMVTIAYDPKVARAMDDLGLADFGIDLTQVTGSKLGERVADAYENRDALRKRMGAALAPIRQRAGENRRVLAEVLDGKTATPPLDKETISAIHRVTLERVADDATLERETQALRDRLADATGRLSQEQRLVEITQQQLNELWDSRAMRVARTYWAARGTARSALRKAAAVTGRPSREDTPQQTLDPATLEVIRSGLDDQLDTILDRHEDAPGFVVFPPGIGWGVTLFQRPQQMALAFARIGYVVIYNLLENNAEMVRGFHEYAPRMYLAHVPDQAVDVLDRLPRPLVITYVYNFDWSRNLPGATTVYDHIDELEVFTAAYPITELRRWHAEAMRNADLVTGSARDLHRHLLESRPDALLVPNGVDYGHFAYYRETGQIPEGLESIAGRPLVGYYGALAEWLDYDLIEYAAKALPECEFVFIGPDYDGSSKKSVAFDLPNVTWLGPKPYTELPAYLARFDVATIPFEVSDVTHSVSPLKLFEYMAGGRPIVIPALREAGAYPGVLVGDDYEGYVARIKEALALGDDAEYVAKLRRTARNNTWERRVLTLVDAAARAETIRDKD